jgi:hypothetical protein
MTQQFLHRPNIVSVFEQVRRKAMAKRMTTSISVELT